MSTKKQSAGGRLSVITIDQAIAGASNVLIAVLAARLLGVAAFGLFGIVFLVYVMVQGVSRALVCDPLLVHPEEAETRTADIIGTSVLLASALAVVVLAAGLATRLVDERLGNALVVLAICVPLLVAQDLGRYMAFATQRPARALALDVTWLVLMFGTVAALFVTDTRSLAWFIAAWGGAGAVAGLLLFWQHRAVRIRPGLTWLRYTWGFSWRYLVSYTSTQGAALAGASGVGAIAGARQLGGVQGALLLVRPFMTFQVAAIAATIGEVTRSLHARDELRRHVVRASTFTTIIAVGNTAVLLALPDSLGRAVLGDSWSAAQPLLLPTGLQIVCLGLMTGVRSGILGMRAIRKAMILDVVATAIVLVACVSGAVIDGARGAVWAVAIGQAVMTVAWWMTFLAHSRDADPAAAGDPPPPPSTQMASVTVPSSPPA